MKPVYLIPLGLFLVLFLFLPSSILAQGNEFAKYEMSFKNFLTCEFTRTSARDHFKGKDFKINMIDLYDIQRESGMVIITGSVLFAVEGQYHKLYVALGVESIMDKEKVSYYTVRQNDFSILATELMRFSYKERCPWSRYWLDID
jgi:hypothetical protein